MLMSAPVRKFALTTHVVTSVGWMGAIACFLALAIQVLTSSQLVQVQSASWRWSSCAGPSSCR